MARASIIIPAYNAAAYIDAALASVCSQSEPDLEILVIDDCSSDDTRDRVADAARLDPRVRLLRTSSNGGPSAARNLGLANATGDWVALLDADDSMAADRIASLIALAEAKGADMASDNLLLIDETGVTAPAPMIPAAWLPVEQRLHTAEFITRNVSDPEYPRVGYGFMKPLIRREFLVRHGLRYDEAVRFAEDLALYIRCLRAGAVWWVTPRPLYRYLVRANSLTEVQTSADLDHLRRTQRAMLEDPQVQADPELRRAVARHLAGVDRSYYYRAFTDAVKAGRLATAGGVLFESRRSLPMIAREGLRQTPRLAAKLARGGFARQGADA